MRLESVIMISDLYQLKREWSRVRWTFLVLICLMYFVPSVWAQQAASGRITQINVEKNGGYVRVLLDAATINPGNCPGGDYYILEVVGSQTNRMIAAMYMAMAQRLNVTMWISGCTSGPYWGSARPSIYDVYVTSP